ncbi:hypothetical protein BRC64_02765 [Halobacteriales archaeon QH_10_67_22]|nr:MAG: hypothetical protein BRC64_02765 [Halobacteriales archaeon QH_10_67_22]
MVTSSADPKDRHISTDKETIREWADSHNAVPVRRDSDGSLDFVHEYRVSAKHRRLDWDTFNDELEQKGGAVSYRVDGLGTPEVVTHEQVVDRSDIEDKRIRDRLVAGETVTTTIRETSAVETPVVEEATVESELTDREVVHEELLATDFVDRTFTVVSSDDPPDADMFDHDRYVASLEASGSERARQLERQDSEENNRSWVATSTKSPLKGGAEVYIRHVWEVTRKVTERFTVESRITGTDVTEAETLEDYDLDVTGLQRSIIEQGMLDTDGEPGEATRDFEIESELAEGNRVHTHFKRTSVVKDEVVDQARASFADIERVEPVGMDFINSRRVVSEETTETLRPEAGGMVLTNEDVGKDIVDFNENTVGTIESITDGGQTAYVEPHSSITDRVTSALGWDDDDSREMEVYVGQFADVTREEIRLKEHEQLAENRRPR